MASELSHARHDLRGRLNALKLCITALQVSETREEAVQFLDYIVSGTEQLEAALDVFLDAYAADLRNTGSG